MKNANDLKNELNKMGYAVILWHKDDVNYVAENLLGKELKNDEVDNVLRLIENKHDSNNGVTWDTIEFYVSNL